ncbi:hypothetical protein [Celeribacter arenosi]|uniref:Uncharacterized protein n=1 Tax=Celeribacter arenosi TaxID=792649 RepID=A0ABP7KFP8_9RHOB
MSNKEVAEGAVELISTKEVATFFGSSQTFARELMRRLDIPKRGGGYSRARLLAAMGFAHPYPLDNSEVWKPLLDASAVGKATGQSAKTIGRMFDGTHADKSFTNRFYLGPRKRLVFSFEVKSWQLCLPPLFKRDVSRMHPEFLKSATTDIKNEPARMRTNRTEPGSVAALFQPPKKAE